jgi:hypothetical protein
MYDAEGFQVANPIDHFAIGWCSRAMISVTTLRDASLDIYMQNTHVSRCKKGVKLVAIPS